MSHRLVITKEGTVAGRRSISFACADKTCDTAGNIQANPHASADEVFAVLAKEHDDPDLFTAPTA